MKFSIAIFDQHQMMLAESGVTPEVAAARGYVSVDTKTRLAGIKITAAGRNVPGLLVPMHGVDRSVWGYQYRPDHPRTTSAGRVIKYETPTGQRNGIDVPPMIADQLGDPTVDLWITEGSKKADAAVVHGLTCVALPGVWSWRGTNGAGGKTALADWHDVALNGRRVILAFDSDVMSKPAVHAALTQLADYLATKGANVAYAHLPAGGDKCGLDDYILEQTVTELMMLVQPAPPPIEVEEDVAVDDVPAPVRPARRTLAEVEAVFARWLGDKYDLGVLAAVLACAAAEKLTGDPPWLMVVSGPGAAKTETVAALAGAGGHVTSTITSEGALLSATSQRERSRDASGGLLPRIGERGLLVIKDVTSVLGMPAMTRGPVLNALREVYDGLWERNVGTDGGRSLTWRGRLVVIGAVTTAWDQAHAVISAMGDRFVLVRLDSTQDRQAAGRQAINNTGSEVEMRTDLAEAVGGLLAGVGDPGDLTDAETDLLLALADLVTLARTSVEVDPAGNVLEAHAPEMPTRFAKQLAQIVRGAVAIGMSRPEALGIAARCARDSVPPLRLAVLLAVMDNRAQPTTADVQAKLDRPRTSVDRTLQALHQLGLLRQRRGLPNQPWSYEFAGDRAALEALTRGTQESKYTGFKGRKETACATSASDEAPTYISGYDPCPTCGRCLANPPGDCPHPNLHEAA